MLLDFTSLVAKYDLKITGILHLGANLAQEAREYSSLDIHNVVWVEANGDNIPAIKRAVEPYGHYVIEALITDVDGDERMFNITNYDSMSSSIFDFGTHPTFSPDTVFVDHRVLTTSTVDSLMKLHHQTVFSGINMLNMDLQGAEMLALRGARNFIKQVDIVMSEVNTAEVYVGCAQLEELDAFLGDEGFKRVETHMVGNQGWGDGLWLRGH